MSDLQCPATLLLVQHDDADPPAQHVEHHEGGRLSDAGRAQVSDLVERVRARRIAGVYCSSLDRAVQSAGLAASGLGVMPVVVDGLQEASAGEDDDAVVSRFRGALEAIADVHRGETVLVFTHGGLMLSVLPRLCANVRHDRSAHQVVPGCMPAEVEVDADGWRLVSWPGNQEGSEQP